MCYTDTFLPALFPNLVLTQISILVNQLSLESIQVTKLLRFAIKKNLFLEIGLIRCVFACTGPVAITRRLKGGAIYPIK